MRADIFLKQLLIQLLVFILFLIDWYYLEYLSFLLIHFLQALITVGLLIGVFLVKRILIIFPKLFRQWPLNTQVIIAGL